MSQVFIAWSGNKPLAELVKREIKKYKGYDAIVGGDDPSNWRDYFVGSTIRHQMDASDQAIFLIQNRADRESNAKDTKPQFSSNLMYEIGYFCGQQSVSDNTNKNTHNFFIDMDIKEAPSDMQGAWGHVILSENRTQEEIAAEICEIFMRDQKNDFSENKMAAIIDYKRVRSYILHHNSNPALNNYQMAMYIVCYTYSAYIFPSIRDDVRRELDTFRDELSAHAKQSKELCYALDCARHALNFFAEIRYDDNKFKTNRQFLGRYIKDYTRVRDNFNLDLKRVNRELADSEIKTLLILTLNNFLCYANLLKVNCDDTDETHELMYCTSVLEYGGYTSGACDELDAANSDVNTEFCDLIRAYVSRNLFLAYSRLESLKVDTLSNNPQYSEKLTGMSFNEEKLRFLNKTVELRQELCYLYADSKPFFECIEMEYYLSLAEKYAFADEYSKRQIVDDIGEYRKKIKNNISDEYIVRQTINHLVPDRAEPADDMPLGGERGENQPDVPERCAPRSEPLFREERKESGKEQRRESPSDYGYPRPVTPADDSDGIFRADGKLYGGTDALFRRSEPTGADDNGFGDMLSSIFDGNDRFSYGMREDPAPRNVYKLPSQNCLESYSDGIVSFKELLPVKRMTFDADAPTVALGKNSKGRSGYLNIDRHILIAGATGSATGSICTAAIMSVLYSMSPDVTRLILIDPVGTDFVRFNGMPHLLGGEAMTDFGMAVEALKRAKSETEKRLELFKEQSAQDIYYYNARNPKIKLCKIVVIVNQFQYLTGDGGEFAETLGYLLESGRAAGVYVMLKTDLATDSVITRAITEHISVRIACKAVTGKDSEIICGREGAEQLARDECLVCDDEEKETYRIKVCYISGTDVANTLGNIRDDNPLPFISGLLGNWNFAARSAPRLIDHTAGIFNDYNEADADPTVSIDWLKLQNWLKKCKVEAELSGVITGAAVVRYDVKIDASQVKTALRRKDELAYEFGRADTNAYYNYDEGVLSVEVPRKNGDTVGIKKVLSSRRFVNAKQNSLTFALGEKIDGEAVCPDLAKMPHLLVAGSVGSGKTVCLHSIVISLVSRLGPEELRLILIDPKQVEFTAYRKLPHLLTGETICDCSEALSALRGAVAEMERRYTLFTDMCRSGAIVKNIDEYNKHAAPDKKLPKIVIVIDEFADLMATDKKETESCLVKLLQKSRACGIHLVIGTQRSSADVITGVIKANIPNRIALKVSSSIDSRTILDTDGAEKLLGGGDMLLRTPESYEPVRLQCCLITQEEIEKAVAFIAKYNPKPAYIIMPDIPAAKEEPDELLAEERDDGVDAVWKRVLKQKKADRRVAVPHIYAEVLKNCIEYGTASISYIQRRFSVGFNRANSIMEWMEDQGFVSGRIGSLARKMLITREEYDKIIWDFTD